MPAFSAMDGGATPTAIDRAATSHAGRWGAPAFVARAPGRVNLIGEHTDYNDGWVLPMALPFDTAVAVSPGGHDATVEVVSDGFGAVTLGVDAVDRSHWAVHLDGVRTLLAELGHDPGPWRATVATDVPTGASLSSSAALEVAATLSILHLCGEEWSPVEVARLCQRVENEVVGLPSGIMDQLISADAVEGHATLIDCRSLAMTPSPLPADVSVVVLDTGTRRQLVDSAFEARRDSCARAAAALGVPALRDADVAMIGRLPGDLHEERRRARHVVTENERTLQAAAAMAAGDAAALGALMQESHRSLRDDYEVSSPALDEMCAHAMRAPGCLGARMTGGGFAGCAVALVETSTVGEFCDRVLDGFGVAGEHPPAAWVCRPSRGATIEPV